jgi:hypothetical protein
MTENKEEIAIDARTLLDALKSVGGFVQGENPRSVLIDGVYDLDEVMRAFLGAKYYRSR